MDLFRDSDHIFKYAVQCTAVASERLLYRGVFRWMSDLRERLRICSLAQLYTTRDSSLTQEPTEPATKRLSRRTFFLSSLALRADSAGSLCLADRRYDGPQVVTSTEVLQTSVASERISKQDLP